MKLGVCYYPEQWPEAMWAGDARRMREAGLSRVRIGEFAWSRIEPQPGCFDWGWYDRAIDTLAAAGLELILGTPTATPPKWLVDTHPEILAWDANGMPRRFGSRRHYCFSSPVYREQSRRICAEVAGRYGKHQAVRAWQTDNEFGCHDTVLSYSPAAAQGFRQWLQRRYGSIDRLNQAWGTMFWSQEYGSFDAVDLPNLTVTEANPAHRLDFMRFASDEVAEYNREQVAILRDLSPGREVVHNYMGFFTDFDHHLVSQDLDVAAWDSYPLGFLDQSDAPAAIKRRYMRQGHPDFAGFHHDLYRGCGRGRMWVLEQQPGPVNWAPHNPAPLPGMVRLWTWEAFAHGAELVSYFRWRQAPFAQEQMHAGLHRPDDVAAPGLAEVGQVAAELGSIEPKQRTQAPVALIFSYEAVWTLQIQPQGASFDPLQQLFDWYSGLRALGIDVDILPPGVSFKGYSLIVVPGLASVTDEFAGRLANSGARLLIGCRSGSKTEDFQVPPGLPPGPLRRLIDLRVTAVESLPPGHSEAVERDLGNVVTWLEHVETDCAVRGRLQSGRPVWLSNGRCDYLAACPDAQLMASILRTLAAESGVEAAPLPEGLRLSRRGNLRFAVNYAPDRVDMPETLTNGADFLVGEGTLAPGGVAIWREAVQGGPANHTDASNR
jgi:beta-galactosidase